MAKKNRIGHYCKVCGRYRANEKFSGKGHRQHICKECHRERQAQKRDRKRASKRAAEVGLPPLRRHPMTTKQAASYLKITPAAFDYRRKKLEIEPCDTYKTQYDEGFLFDIEAIIAVHQYGQSDVSEKD